MDLARPYQIQLAYFHNVFVIFGGQSLTNKRYLLYHEQNICSLPTTNQVIIYGINIFVQSKLKFINPEQW